MPSTFEKGFGRGVSDPNIFQLGVKSYQTGLERRRDAEAEIEERRQKLAQQNKQTEAFANALGIDIYNDPVTGEKRIPEIRTDQPFERPDPRTEAMLFSQMGEQQQQAYGEIIDRTTPQEDKYTTPKRTYNPETDTYDLMSFNRTKGVMEKVGVDDTFNRKKFSGVITGQVELDNGEKVGQPNRKTYLTVWEKGNKYDVQDLGRVKSGSGSGAESDVNTDELKFQLELADLGTKIDTVRSKRDKYLRGKFADEQSRDAYRDGINSSLNELALEYASLGTIPAEQEILGIMADANRIIGKETVGGVGTVTRKQFYETTKARIIDEWNGGIWGYEDAMAILQYLNAKFNLFLDYADPKRDSDELQLDMDDIINQTKITEEE